MEPGSSSGRQEGSREYLGHIFYRSDRALGRCANLSSVYLLSLCSVTLSVHERRCWQSTALVMVNEGVLAVRGPEAASVDTEQQD